MVTPRKRKPMDKVVKAAGKTAVRSKTVKSASARGKSVAKAAVATRIAGKPERAAKLAKTGSATKSAGKSERAAKIAKAVKATKAARLNNADVAAKAAAGKTVHKPVLPGVPQTSAAGGKRARPASAKTAAKAVAAARTGVSSKKRAPSYIPRSTFHDDWMPAGPAELPRQPKPAAHTPVRKPPKPRAPKPKAISHEQAVANLKALLESRKRKDRSAVAAAKGA